MPLHAIELGTVRLKARSSEDHSRQDARSHAGALLTGALRSLLVPATACCEHLISDPEVCHGQATFRGTRITVDAAFAMRSQGYTVDQILEGWRELTPAGIEEAIARSRAGKVACVIRATDRVAGHKRPKGGSWCRYRGAPSREPAEGYPALHRDLRGRAA